MNWRILEIKKSVEGFQTITQELSEYIDDEIMSKDILEIFFQKVWI